LGSLEALGNPKHLLMGYASAVSDIFIEPAASAVSSPKDVLSSMQHGTTSLIHNVVGSSLGSIASVSDAFSRGISSVTGDSRASESAKIRSAGEGLKHGAQSLGMGLFSGITGVVTKPMEGARAEGGGFSFGGFMKGVASGVIGVVAQPVKGVADMISDVGKGIDSSTARLHGHKSIERLRAARPPSRWLTHPYTTYSLIPHTHFWF
jgi:vacuolar protein sorting-associated protein 13A/C